MATLVAGSGLRASSPRMWRVGSYDVTTDRHDRHQTEQQAIAKTFFALELRSVQEIEKSANNELTKMNY